MRRRKWKKTLTTLLYTLLPMLVVGMFALPVQGLGIDVSDFNPIGKALDPIENLIPNFVIKGHIKQDIRRNIHGKSNSSGGTGHHGLFGSPVDIAAKEGRFRQWDWDQIWTTGELEMRWRPHPNVEIVNFWNQRYDAVFDLDHWWKDNQTKVIGGKEYVIRNDDVSDELKYYHTWKRALREAYANVFVGPVTLTLGKQQTVWGKIDFRVIDIVNPIDGRHGNFKSITDERWLRLPTWAMKGLYTFPSGNYYIETTIVPDFENNPTNGAGHVWDLNNPKKVLINAAPGARGKIRTDEPSMNVDNWEWFFRFGFNIQGWDGFFFYGNHWGDSPRSFKQGGAYYKRYTRINSFGAAFDKMFWFLGRSMTVIYEGKLDDNAYSLSLNEGFGEMRQKKRGNLTQAVELDTYMLGGDLGLAFFVVQIHNFSWNRNMPGPANTPHQNHWVLAWAGSYAVSQLEDRVRFGYNGRIRPVNGDGRHQWFVSYVFSDYLTASLNLRTWWGGNNNDIADGIMRDRDLLDLRLAYHF